MTSSRQSPCFATRSSNASAPFPAMCPGRSSTSSGLARRSRALERPKSTNRFSSLSRWPSRHSGSHGGSSPTSSSAIAWVKSPPLTWPVRSASKTPRRSWPCAAARSNPRRDEAEWSPSRFRLMRLRRRIARPRRRALHQRRQRPRLDHDFRRTEHGRGVREKLCARKVVSRRFSTSTLRFTALTWSPPVASLRQPLEI